MKEVDRHLEEKHVHNAVRLVGLLRHLCMFSP